MPKHDPMPRSVTPMLCKLVSEPFDREGWYFEPKWDGYRAIAEIEKGNVRLYSRNGQSFNRDYPELVSALAKIKHDAVLDGEIVVMDGGKPNFQMLQNYGRNTSGNLEYIAFDILYMDGKSLTQLPLRERKQALRSMLPRIAHLSFGEHVEMHGKAFFAATKKQGLEGMIAKEAGSPYLPGQRTQHWQKIKSHLRQEVVICGFTEARGSRSRFGALVLGLYTRGKLTYAGHTGTGFDEKSLDVVYSKLSRLVRKTCPFETEPKTNEPATWVEPKLVCEVSFAQWTSDGAMRQPVFMGLRPDKKATDVRKE